jgi:hypothetical protein
LPKHCKVLDLLNQNCPKVDVVDKMNAHDFVDQKTVGEPMEDRKECCAAQTQVPDADYGSLKRTWMGAIDVVHLDLRTSQIAGDDGTRHRTPNVSIAASSHTVRYVGSVVSPGLVRSRTTKDPNMILPLEMLVFPNAVMKAPKHSPPSFLIFPQCLLRLMPLHNPEGW